MRLVTTRLCLISCGLPEFEALHRGKPALGAWLEAHVPDEWPTFSDSIFHFEEPLRADPLLDGWGTWLVVHTLDRVLMGEGGYAGKPTPQGRVELGYAMVPSYRGYGYATEFALALLHHAFEEPSVQEVTAGTERSGSDALASIAVARRLGMHQIDETPEGYLWGISRKIFETE